MFKKATKHISRAGTTPVKVLFRIEVKTVALKSLKDVIDGSTINVCFERSGKLAATKDVSLSAEGELLCASFDQTLSLVVTLYKNADGSYQEKTGKLIVRQPKLSMMGGTTFRGLGIIGLDLHEIASSYSLAPKKVNLQLSKCPEGSGVLETIITSKFIGESDPDETGSNISADSATLSTTDAAEFEAKRLGNSNSVGRIDDLTINVPSSSSDAPRVVGTPRQQLSQVSTSSSSSTNPGVMSSAAISVLQERCNDLQSTLNSKDETISSLRNKLSTMEGNYREEINGLQLELDSTKASLRRTQGEKKVLKLEKGELEVSLSSANASAEARIKEEVSKERSKLQGKVASLESRLATTDQSAVSKSDSSSELRKFKEQCLAQEEEIDSLVGQIEAMKRNELHSSSSSLMVQDNVLQAKCMEQEKEIQSLLAKLDSNRETSQASMNDYNGDDNIQRLIQEIDTLQKQLSKEKAINKQIRTEYKSNVDGVSTEERLVMEREIDELKIAVRQEQSQKKDLEKELKRTRTFMESPSFSPDKSDALPSTLVSQLRSQLEMTEKDRDEKERSLVELQHSTEITVRELSSALDDSRYKSEKSEKYLRQQLDVLTRESTAEITTLREELEQTKSALRRQTEAYQRSKDAEEETQSCAAETLSKFKEQAASCETDMKLQMKTIQEQMQKNISALQNDLRKTRAELRETRAKHSEAIILERSNAEKILLSSIQAVKDQASEMEESLKKMHRQELATRTNEINNLTRFYEENRAKVVSTDDSGGYAALVSVLSTEMSLLKETMTNYMSWDSSVAENLVKTEFESSVNESENDHSKYREEIAIELEPNEDGIITGAISIVVDDSVGSQYEDASIARNTHDNSSSDLADRNVEYGDSRSRKENDELCRVLLSTLQKSINVLEHDPYSDPDSAYMKQAKEMEALKLSYQYSQESLISQKLELDSTKSALEILQKQTSSLKSNLSSINDETLLEIRTEAEKVKKELDAAMASIATLEEEKERLRLDFVACQEELTVCKFSRKESENKLSSLELRMENMRGEYEEETRRIREKLEKSREESLKEANQRLDIIELEKARLETKWTQSIALERDLKAKAETSLKEHFERIIKERNDQLASCESELDALKVEHRSLLNSTSSSRDNSEPTAYASLLAELAMMKEKHRERTREVVDLKERIQGYKVEKISRKRYEEVEKNDFGHDHDDDESSVHTYAYTKDEFDPHCDPATEKIMGNALVIAREEAKEAMDLYGQSQNMLEELKREHTKILRELDSVREDHAVEIEGSRWAVEAISEANLKRADMESQYDQILEELIEHKMKNAEIAEMLDVEKARTLHQKQKILQYAERVAALEVQLNTSIF